VSVRHRARRGALAAVALLVVLALLHGAAWLWATERLRSGYEAWAASLRAQGWTVRSGPPVLAGWPLTAELAVPSPALAGGGDLVPGGVAWSSEGVRLRLSPLAPGTLEIVAEGAQRVRLATLPEAVVTAGLLAVEAPLAGDGTAELRGRAVQVAVAGERVEIAMLRAVPIPGGVRAEAQAIALPQGYAWALGASVEAASADVVVTGSPAPALPGATAAQQAARWRDAGGRVDVPQFALRWGPLDAGGSGSGTLDARLQPRAEASVQLRGWPAALDQLTRGGAILPGAALAARAALGLFARASGGSAQGAAVVPLAVANGVLTAGGIPLLRLPEVAWP
jgi:hypothetical protein